MILEHSERIEKAAALMEAYDAQNPIGTGKGRYLWTDAFAVCNFLSLYKRTGEKRYLEKARILIDTVHRELGAFRGDDAREGPLSGLAAADAASYPTVAGLRIGKPQPERGADAAYDEASEWDRDGQYFHYLTKWMHALDRMASVSGEVRYSRWAVELAKSAHRAFTYALPDGSKRMYWKMSIDLRRPLVASMGQHDALEAYVTYLQLSMTARALGDDAGLGGELEAAGTMAEAMPLATEDPLGLGGMLFDAARVTQLMAGHDLPLRGLLRSLLEAAREGTSRYAQSNALRHPADARLPFRELGLGIGLHGVSLMQALNGAVLHNAILAEQLEGLQAFVPIAEVLELFWLREAHQAVGTWQGHAGINSVMLATSLLPDAFLTVGSGDDA
ncbi:hypothetical protein LOH54_01575 [Sulfurimonas sp. HSL-3221]|uniref:hypothetical protein n=1 Tax=Sulfurimonadaceae TaxID=2771471 RepID=UPI001E387279|nr:hypothetical protein [Sulfurimonas sp. HSL-3221]UFS62831.1 hypothetical protein LOH54_01575 [Sulfurimonas sp. HSL-3221]